MKGQEVDRRIDFLALPPAVLSKSRIARPFALETIGGAPIGRAIFSWGLSTGRCAEAFETP